MSTYDQRTGDEPAHPPEPKAGDDCIHVVEDIARYTDELEAYARGLVFLVGEMPRTNSPEAERALVRVGIVIERIAHVATTAALQATAAVQSLRRTHAPAAPPAQAPTAERAAKVHGHGNVNGGDGAAPERGVVHGH